jgi:hypothetical protein
MMTGVMNALFLTSAQLIADGQRRHMPRAFKLAIRGPCESPPKTRGCSDLHKASPFPNVRFFAPPRPGDTAGTPDATARDQAVSLLDARGVLRRRAVPFGVADAKDERTQCTMLIGQVAARLRLDHIRTLGDPVCTRIDGVGV